jgi:Ca2+/Na+ antiporter
MSFLVHIVKLFGYLFALISGAWCVSEGGDILGDKYDASILGGFIIAWLNTAPETIFFRLIHF